MTEKTEEQLDQEAVEAVTKVYREAYQKLQTASRLTKWEAHLVSFLVAEELNARGRGEK